MIEIQDASGGFEFKNVSQRMIGEAEERARLVANALPYNVTFLDDALRAILPHDLVLIGATSGVGKTQLAMSIAASNAQAGKRVHYIALEAEERELDRRLKFRMVVERAASLRISSGGLNYTNWFLGRCSPEIRALEAEVLDEMHLRYRTLRIFYKQACKYSATEIRAMFEQIRDESDLIVLDHLHYVDIEDQNEHRGLRDLVKAIRDTSIAVGRPVIVVAHLRKQNHGPTRGVVPDLDDFHGTSEITKIATHAIMIAPANREDFPAAAACLSNTFMHVPKDRRSGATGFVAMCQYNLATGMYLSDYQLGRATSGKPGWSPVGDAPSWAVNHRVIL